MTMRQKAQHEQHSQNVTWCSNLLNMLEVMSNLNMLDTCGTKHVRSVQHAQVPHDVLTMLLSNMLDILSASDSLQRGPGVVHTTAPPIKT